MISGTSIRDLLKLLHHDSSISQKPLLSVTQGCQRTSLDTRHLGPIKHLYPAKATDILVQKVKASFLINLHISYVLTIESQVNPYENNIFLHQLTTSHASMDKPEKFRASVQKLTQQ